MHRENPKGHRCILNLSTAVRRVYRTGVFLFFIVVFCFCRGNRQHSQCVFVCACVCSSSSWAGNRGGLLCTVCTAGAQHQLTLFLTPTVIIFCCVTPARGQTTRQRVCSLLFFSRFTILTCEIVGFKAAYPFCVVFMHGHTHAHSC